MPGQFYYDGDLTYLQDEPEEIHEDGCCCRLCIKEKS